MNSVNIDLSDLRYYSTPDVVRRIGDSGIAGFLTYAVFSASLGYLSTLLSVAVSVPMVLFAVYRNRILTRIVRKGFVVAFTFGRFVGAIFYASSIILFSGAILLLLSPKGHTGYVPLILGFALSSVSGEWNMFMNPRAIGKLSIEQFLFQLGQGNPNFPWLRRGVQSVEKRLNRVGLTCAKSSLFLGASYALMRKHEVEADIKALSAWVGQPGNELDPMILPSVVHFLEEARDAEKVGFRAAPTISDKMSELPWQQISYATGSLAIVVGFIVAIIRFFNIS